MNNQQIKDIIEHLKYGQVGVMPTDTIYGIVASVRYERSIEDIYNKTNRPKTKPFIVLISNLSQLNDLGITLSDVEKLATQKFWPGPVSFIFSSTSQQYLHRGRKTLAVRLPDSEWLRNIIDVTGPIIATSANLAGQPTPDDIDLIKEELPDFDFYIDGPVTSSASKLVKVEEDDSLTWLDR